MSHKKSGWRTVAALSLGLCWSSLCWGGGFRNSAVGGVSIDAEGVVSRATIAMTRAFQQAMLERLGPVPGELDQRTELRRVSLRQLCEAITPAIYNDLSDLPNEIRYLAGIQRIQYIFVYPEANDIVLAGPGEGWVVNQAGNVVGKTTGRPVIHLEDLLVALRSVDAARDVGVSCSIDPTAEGRKRFQAFMRQQKQFRPGVLEGIAKSLGPQQITLSGVPETSHFARVLVAADYQMKRIAMDLEDAPLRSLPSFLDLLAGSRMKVSNMMPRWWLACDYEPLVRGEDGLAWELRGPGVKVLTEDDFIAADGTTEQTGQRNPLAAEWAKTITAHYDELSHHQNVFGQLRNLMDLCVVAAVISKEGLIERAGCDLSLLTRADSDLVLASLHPPRTVDTQCSFTKRGREYLITASGGVQIDSWQVAGRWQLGTEIDHLRGNARITSENWWKN